MTLEHGGQRFAVHYNMQAMRDYFNLLHRDWIADIAEAKLLGQKEGVAFTEILKAGQAEGRYAGDAVGRSGLPRAAGAENGGDPRLPHRRRGRAGGADGAGGGGPRGNSPSTRGAGRSGNCGRSTGSEGRWGFDPRMNTNWHE